jgi:hypothetical protein
LVLAGTGDFSGVFATGRKFGMVNRMGAHVCVPAYGSARVHLRARTGL